MEYPAKNSKTKSALSDGQPPPAGRLAGFFKERIPLALKTMAGWLGRFFRRAKAFVVTVVEEFLKDDCPNLAAQISYYAIFSIFPLILGVVLLVSIFTGDPITRATIIRELTAAFPNNSIQIAAIVDETLDQTQQLRPIFFVFFFVGLVWGGTGIFDSITNALNKVWQTPGQQRSFWQTLLLRFILSGIFLVIFISSLLITIIFDVVRNFAESNPELKIYLKDNRIWDWLSYAIPWLLNFATFMIIYRVVPQRKVTWGDVWPGALLATILFELVKISFAFYVTQVARYSATYGSLAGVIVFIFWLYLIAIVLLIGSEVSSVWAEMRGGKQPTKLARQGQLGEADPKHATANPTAELDPSLDYTYACEEVFCAYISPPTKAKQAEQ